MDTDFEAMEEEIEEKEKTYGPEYHIDEPFFRDY